MKKLIAIATLATAAVATPAFADTLTAEVRFGDVRSADTRTIPNTTEYRVEYWSTLGMLNVGAELQSLQGENAGATGSLVSLKAGPALPTVAGIQVVAYGEAGKHIATANNFEFWGAAIGARKDIIGPLSIDVGYRHREGFNAGNINEDRLHAGLGLALTDNTSVGATYYRTRGSLDSDAVGVGITRKF